jgi:protein ImuA
MEAVPLTSVLARPDVWRGGHFADATLPTVATGFAQLDQELPSGGWPRGSLTELLCDGVGQGEVALLLPVLKQLCADDGWLVLIAPPHALHAGAWAMAGIPLERLLIIEAGANKHTHLDALWAAEQALSSDAPSAVLCWSMWAESKSVRRLQLASSTSHAVSFLVRPVQASAQASAAPLRLAISSRQGGLDISILKRRGPPLEKPLHLSLSRPAKWRSHQATHENALARPIPSATVTRHPSSPVF